MTFDKQPTLESDLLRIRPLQADDFDALFAVAADPMLWAQHPVKNRYERDVFETLFTQSLASGGALVVIDKSTNAVIGSSRFNLPDPAANRAEIGWSFLARAYWGGPTNAHVKDLLLTHAFGFVGVVYFRVGATNARSRRAMEKIGGRLTDQTDVIPGSDGQPVPHVIYEIHKADVR